MSVDTDLWNAFWTQLTTNATLLAYVGDISHFYAGFQESILDVSNYPVVIAEPRGITEDRWIGVPTRKISFFRIELHHKVYSTTFALRITDALTLDGHVRNAIESSLTLSGNATLVKISDTEWRNLSDNVREGRMMINVITKRFTAGSR